MTSWAGAFTATVVPCVVALPATAGWMPGRLLVAAAVGAASSMLGAYLGAFVGAPLMGSLVAAAVVAVAARRDPVECARPDPTAEVVLTLIVAVGLILLALAPLRVVAGWDAMAIWMLKAKAIAASGYQGPAFHDAAFGFSHQDYPPAFSAWLAAGLVPTMGAAPGWVSQWQVGWLWLSTSGAVVLLLGPRGRPSQLVAASFVLAPPVLAQLITGYADVPSALLLLLGGVGIFTAVPTWVAALALGAASLVKNEALVFVLGLLCAGVLLDSRHRRKAGTALAAVVLANLPWRVFAAISGLANDTVNADTLGVGRLADLLTERLATVLATVVAQMASAGWWLVLVAVLAGLVSAEQVPVPTLLAALGALTATVAVYVVTPSDYVWHMSSSADRVVVGVWALFVIAAIRGAPRRIPDRLSDALDRPLVRSRDPRR